MASNSVDYFNIDELFTEEERLIRDSVRTYVDEKINPIISSHFMDGTFPFEIIKGMAELGLFGITLPEQYGGANANYTSYGLAMAELERCDSGVRSFASVQNSLVIYPIYKYAGEKLKDYWLPRLVSAEAIGCFGLTEPDFGSNPGGMITTAVKTDNGYLLNGAKMWITNGTIADIAVVWAKLDGEVHGFLVEKGTKGFTAPEMKGKHSLRASITSELVFEDCEIPADNILNIKGLKGPLSCLTQARYGIAWGVIGAAISVYETALEYAK